MITTEFKLKVLDALVQYRKRFDGTEKNFAIRLGMRPEIWSTLKGNPEKVDASLVKDAKWLEWGSLLDVTIKKRRWNTAETDVLKVIRHDATFCKENSKSMMLVDDPEIGKSHTVKWLRANMDNCFVIDCSQAKTKRTFIKAFARALGLEDGGRYDDIKNNIKYYLNSVAIKPLVVLDEAGDLEYPAFLDLKEFWNATDGTCGWYMMGADGLRAKIERGIEARKVGYRELFSRYSSRYGKIVPSVAEQQVQFYRKLVADVLAVNVSDKSLIPRIVAECMKTDAMGKMGGLRRAESLVILYEEQAKKLVATEN